MRCKQAGYFDEKIRKETHVWGAWQAAYEQGRRKSENIKTEYCLENFKVQIRLHDD